MPHFECGAFDHSATSPQRRGVSVAAQYLAAVGPGNKGAGAVASRLGVPARLDYGARRGPEQGAKSIDWGRPQHVVIREPVRGSAIPVQLMFMEMIDGVYAPIGLRMPAGDGPFPLVLFASGNGGGGMAMVRDFTQNASFTQERFLAPVMRSPGCATAPRSITPTTASAS